MQLERCAVITLALSLAVGCANRSSSTSSSGGGQANAPAPAPSQPASAPAAPAPAGRGAGTPQAAVTPAQLEAAMKGISQSNGAMQKNLKANMLTDAAKDAQQLVTFFTDVERFWTQQNKADAIKLAQQGRTGASDVLAAVAANDQMKAMAAAAVIGGTCKQCHSAYREGDAATGYKIKDGVVSQ